MAGSYLPQLGDRQEPARPVRRCLAGGDGRARLAAGAHACSTSNDLGRTRARAAIFPDRQMKGHSRRAGTPRIARGGPSARKGTRRCFLSAPQSIFGTHPGARRPMRTRRARRRGTGQRPGPIGARRTSLPLFRTMRHASVQANSTGKSTERAGGFHRAGGKTALGKGGKGAVEVHGVIASSRSVHSKEDWLLHLVTGQSAPRWRMPLLFTRWYRAAGKNTALPCWHPVNT